MTEEEWLSTPANDLQRVVMAQPARKQRLYVAACCRMLDGGDHQPAMAEALDAVELFGDTGKSKAALRRHRQQLRAIRHSPAGRGFQRVLWAVETAATENMCWSAPFDADFGRIEPLLFADVEIRRRQYAIYADIMGLSRGTAFDARWRTETAVSLAAGIYEARAFDRLPILADALEEAGCDHADVLTHCRGPGPHARGCWVVDAVLGKE
jgi:hypothetical protein